MVIINDQSTMYNGGYRTSFWVGNVWVQSPLVSALFNFRLARISSRFFRGTFPPFSPRFCADLCADPSAYFSPIMRAKRRSPCPPTFPPKILFQEKSFSDLFFKKIFEK